MASVAEFTIPPTSFPFGQTLRKKPDTVISMDQIIPTGESVFPFFWVDGCDPDEFMEVAEDEPEVRETIQLDQFNGRALFRAEWCPNAEIITALDRLNATIVEAVGSSAEWRFEVRTTDRNSFLEFRELFTNHNIPIELDRLYDLERARTPASEYMTEKQREMLILAYEEGYFSLPRTITQQELGDFFDISRRAVSERLRRGFQNLVYETLVRNSQHHKEEAYD